MLELIAQTDPIQTVEWWLKTGVIYGLGTTVVALLCLIFVWFVWKVTCIVVDFIADCRREVPAAIKSQRQLMERLHDSSGQHDETNARTTRAIESLADTARVAESRDYRTVEALEGVVEVVKKNAETQESRHKDVMALLSQTSEAVSKLPAIFVQVQGDAKIEDATGKQKQTGQ